jgi:hypothetical protein
MKLTTMLRALLSFISFRCFSSIATGSVQLWNSQLIMVLIDCPSEFLAIKFKFAIW